MEPTLIFRHKYIDLYEENNNYTQSGERFLGKMNCSLTEFTVILDNLIHISKIRRCLLKKNNNGNEI